MRTALPVHYDALVIPAPKSGSPLVSVIIPAYNVASFISETLDSIFAQTIGNCEIIVVNDGSDDGLERVLRPYFRRIIYRAQQNRGPAAARNAGLLCARGQYAAFLDADDLWYPQYLERMLPLLSNGYDVAYPDAVYFGSSLSNGKRFQRLHPSVEPVTHQRLLSRECQVFVSAIMNRRSVVKSGILFDESLRRSEDFDFWVRLAQSGLRFGFTREVLVKYRGRPDSLTRNACAMAENDIKVYEKLLRDPRTTGGDREIIAGQIAKRRAYLNVVAAKGMICDGRFGEAAERLRSASDYRRNLKITLAMAGLRVAPRLVALYLKGQGIR